ncbi:uncharacterized protein LOC100375586 [Saccoglossus kowalevskii]
MKLIIVIAVTVFGIVNAALTLKRADIVDGNAMARNRRDASSLASDLCSSYFGSDYPYACNNQMMCLYCSGSIGDGMCQVCNGRNECPDGEDEEGCQTSEVPVLNAMCPSNYPYSCATMGTAGIVLCISDGQICDGIFQCSDDSDEYTCDYSVDYGNAVGQCQVPNQPKVGTGGLDVLQAQMLEAHNYFRCLHGVAAMTTWQNAVSDATIAAANSAAAGTLTHTYSGENLAMISSSISEATGFGITKMWYDEIADYNYNDPDSSTGVIGHFTQVVWAESTKLGCDYALDSNNKVHIACEYEPYGNYAGQYTSNVKLPIS